MVARQLGIVAALTGALGVGYSGTFKVKPFVVRRLAVDRGAIVRKLNAFFADRPRPWRRHPSSRLGRRKRQLVAGGAGRSFAAARREARA